MPALENVVAIYGVTRAIAAAESFDAVCAIAIDAVLTTLRADRASLLLSDEQGVMRFRAWHHLSERYRAHTEGHSPWAPDARDPELVAIPDAAETAALGPLRGVVVEEGIRALLFVPLCERGRLIGKFMVYYDAPRVFEPVELYLARILGEQLGFALARFRAQDRAAEVTEELGAVLQAVTDGVTVQEPSGRIRYANDAAARLLGLPSAEHVVNATAAQLAAPYHMIAEDESPFRMEDMPTRHALAGEPASALIGYQRRDGREIKWSRVESQPCRAADGTVRFSVTVTRDVTRARRESETRRFLLEASALLASSLDVEETLGALAGLAVPRLADWCAVELVGDAGIALREVRHRDPAKVALADRLMTRYRPPADAAEGLPAVYRTGEPWIAPVIPPEMWRFGAIDDEHRELLEALALCSALIVPLRVRGTVIGTLQLANAESLRHFDDEDLAVCARLADRAAAAVDNARLYGSVRDAQEKLDLAMRAGRMGNWEYDVDRGTVWWSAAVAALHGIGLDAFDGTFAAFVRDIVPADRDRVIAAVTAAVQDGDDLVIEYRICRPDGAVRWVEGRGRVYRDASGRALRLAGFCLDVSDRKEAEEALHSERERIAKLESIGVLAGGIAHDFNNILTSITGNVSLAARRLDKSHAARSRLAAALTGCERAREITGQLLTFSRGGAPVKAATSLCELVREACGFALQGSNVKAEFTFAHALRPIDADAGQIAQVVHNLVLNAAQAMPAGGRVHVRARNVDVAAGTWPSAAEGGYVRLEIADNGPGIPPETVSRIFDPFFTTKSSGTGLGLTTSHSIVRRHGGHLGVESPPEGGATFVVHLPASTEEPASGPRSQAFPTGRGRILVMDDDAAILDLAGECLRDLGYEPELTADGEAAIARYEAARLAGEPHDLLIMDLTVPGGLGGEEAVRRLREAFPDVRAIVSSGYSNDPVMAKYRDHGFVAVLQKPYGMEELARVVHESLMR